MTYTVSWRRRSAFAKTGLVERQCQTLAEARKTMMMASLTEPDFVPLGIVDSAGREWASNLSEGELSESDYAESDYSEQDYIDNGFDFVEEWPRRSVDDGESSGQSQNLSRRS